MEKKLVTKSKMENIQEINTGDDAYIVIGDGKEAIKVEVEVDLTVTLNFSTLEGSENCSTYPDFLPPRFESDLVHTQYFTIAVG